MVLLLSALTCSVSFFLLLYLIFGAGAKPISSQTADSAEPTDGTVDMNSIGSVQPSVGSRSPVEADWPGPLRTPRFSIEDALLPLVRPIIVLVLVSLVPGYVYLRMREVQKALNVDPRAKINPDAWNAQPLVNPNNFQLKYVPAPPINIQPPAQQINIRPAPKPPRR